MLDVSIIVPARNEEGYVGAALASVAAQTWPRDRLEVIAVDNGSEDGTVGVILAFKAAHPDLAVHLLQEPVAGVSRAKNEGARAAGGRWLLFLDADSWMAPDLVERVVAWGRQGYGAGSIRVRADSRDLIDRAFFGLMELGKVLFSLQAQMFFCAREPFLAIGGFRDDLYLAEDREALARLQQRGLRMCQVRDSWIATSPRRLHRLPFRLNMVLMFVRWALANWGIGRHWPY